MYHFRVKCQYHVRKNCEMHNLQHVTPKRVKKFIYNSFDVILAPGWQVHSSQDRGDDLAPGKGFLLAFYL